MPVGRRATGRHKWRQTGTGLLTKFKVTFYAS